MYRFCLRCWVHCTDVYNFPNVGLTGDTKTSWFAPSQCTDVCNFLSVGSTGDTKISLSWFLWLGFLHGLFNSCPLDRRDGPSGLATPIFSLSSLEHKSLRIVILTIILVQVLCCLYQSPKHYIEIWHERPFSLQPDMFYFSRQISWWFALTPWTGDHCSIACLPCCLGTYAALATRKSSPMSGYRSPPRYPQSFASRNPSSMTKTMEVKNSKGDLRFDIA